MTNERIETVAITDEKLVEWEKPIAVSQTREVINALIAEVRRLREELERFGNAAGDAANKVPTQELPVYPEFDPADHTVKEVIAYLDSVDAHEVERVTAAELNGKARKAILNYSRED